MRTSVESTERNGCVLTGLYMTNALTLMTIDRNQSDQEVNDNLSNLGQRRYRQRQPVWDQTEGEGEVRKYYSW